MVEPRLTKDYAIVDTVWQRVYPSGTGPIEHDRPAVKMNFCRRCDLQIGLLEALAFSKEETVSGAVSRIQSRRDRNLWH